ncbi:MAG: diguanylate cyclase [Ignavibacteria bacterium]
MRPLHSTKTRLQRRGARPQTSARLGGAANDASAERGPNAAMAAYEWPAVLDHLREPAFVHDRDCRILRCNAAYAEHAGQPMSQIVGEPYWQVFPKLPSAPAACEVDHPHEGRDACVFTTQEGRTFAVHEVAAPCSAGNFWYCRHLLEDVTERTRLENELKREKAISDAIIECAPNAFFLIDEAGGLVRWNSYLKERTGLPDDQLRGRSALLLLHPDDRVMASAKLLTALATGSVRMEVRVGDGARYFLTTARRVVIDGQPHIAGFCVDITDRRRAEELLEDQKAFLDALVENIPGVFCVLDGEGSYVRWNSNLNKLTGLGDEELYKQSSLLTIAEEDRPLAALKLREAFELGYVKAVLHVNSKDRGVRAFLMTGRRFDVGGVPYVIGVGIDTTDQLAMICALEREARTDPLTQIANRSHFLHRAVDEFARCRRYGHPLSVWMLDLDKFKSVNDVHGHQAGDAVLRAFVDISRDALRDWDAIGRMGGEEFGVLLPETDAEQALLAAERLRQAVANTPVAVGSGNPISVTVSIGIAAMRAEDLDVHALFARADGALYEAKNTGRDKVHMG